MARLMLNFVGPPTLTLHSNQQSNAACFSVSEEREVTQLAWYRAATSGQGVPTRLSLWRASDGAELYGTNSVPDNGAVGWQVHNLSAPVALAAGVEYRAGGCSPAGTNYALIPGTSSGAPESPLSFAATKGRFNDGSCPMPASTTTSIILFDVTVEETSEDTPDDTPASEIDVDNAFQRWLNPSNDQYHTEGAPALALSELTDPTTGLDAIKTRINDTKTRVDEIETSILANAETLNDGLETVLVNALGPAGGMGTGAARVLIDALQASIDNNLPFTLKAQGGTQAIAPPSDAGWDVVASGAFAGPFYMTHRCDRLYVHITTVGEAMTTIEIEGFHFVNRPWWWLPVHSGNVGTYQTSRALEACLLVPAMRVDGFLVVVPTDFEGTWEASIYNP